MGTMKKLIGYTLIIIVFIFAVPAFAREKVSIYLFNQQVPDNEIIVKKEQVFISWQFLTRAFQGETKTLKNTNLTKVILKNNVFIDFNDFVEKSNIKKDYYYYYYEQSNTYLINRKTRPLFKNNKPKKTRPKKTYTAGRVDGTVSWTDYGTVSPASGVHLTLKNIGPLMLTNGKIQGAEIYHTFTDKKGVFTFDRVASGSYVISGRHVITISHPDVTWTSYKSNMVITWSVPLEVTASKNTRIHLNNSNGQIKWEEYK